MPPHSRARRATALSAETDRGPHRGRAAPDHVRTAAIIKRGFDGYLTAFRAISRRAATHFDARDWLEMQRDAKRRLDLYATTVDALIADVQEVLGAHEANREVWIRVKRAFAESIAGSPAFEIAESFFNSITRRTFTTVGVDPQIEFVDYAFGRAPAGLADTPYRTYVRGEPTTDVFEHMLRDCGFGTPYPDLVADAGAIAERVEAAWQAGAAPMPFESVEVLRSVFYRRKGAYLIGRVRGGHRIMPLIVAFVNEPTGLRADAALVTEDDASVVFSFTHSYFHADVDQPGAVVSFLQSIVPLKPVAELYSAIGFNKHGKTELFRDLQRHIAHSDDKFERAPGVPGMVMAVFAMPGFDVVFKVIRDAFPAPKRTTPGDVRRRYRLVFQHDRAGRLVDAQEFEHLTFSRHRFADALLEELLTTAGRNVTLHGDEVTISHLYTERRVRPLDLVLRDAPPDLRARALTDYGRAISDLAATNIFPGDLLFKNFGVTRQGRVVFYDYDELCLLPECTFRDIPAARTPEDELSAEPWYHVAPGDVFPEEFLHFLALPESEREAFRDAYPEIFAAEFWQGMQQRTAAGELVDVYPYRSALRLRTG